MPAITPLPLAETKTHTIENQDVSIQIERDTGWIRSLLFKGENVDLFALNRGGIPSYIGCLRIYDEYTESWFSDLNDAFSVSDMKACENSVSFTKQFHKAEFTLSVTLELDSEAFHWTVNAVKTAPDRADRSLRVYFIWPLISGWDFWAPAYDSEFTFDGMSSFEFMHVQIPYCGNREIILPMVSHFSKVLDVGFSVMEPIDARVPAAKFQYANGEKCFNWGSMKKDIRSSPVLEVVNYYIGLVGNRPMSTKIMMMFHEGDWRPGLGKVFNRWKEFFIPTSDTIYEFEGTFSCEGVQTADSIQRCKDFGLTTLEVHAHFQYYGDYFQEGKDTWHTNKARETFAQIHRNDMTAEQVDHFFETHSDDEISQSLQKSLPADSSKRHISVRHHRSDIKERLAKLAESGVGCYWYFNYSDGYRPIVEAEWPDAIAKNEDGSPQPSGWYNSHNMNADPQWSFGQHMIRDAKRIFETYPTLVGFFKDCFRHFEIDFGHDDGVTVVNNKPAYSMNFSYDDVERTIHEFMNPHGLASFANKPQTIRSMRWTDGALLEGDGNNAEEKFFWACIAKPLFFMWTSDHKTLDENLRRSVLHGCFPKFDTDPKRSYEDNRIHFNQYLPLCGQFKRRVLCFESDPLRVPDGSRGKLFTIGDDYIAGIISEFLAREDAVQYAKIPHAVFRVSRGHDIIKAGVMVPGDRDWEFVDFTFDGTFIYVPIKRYKNCATIRLFVGKRSGKSIGPGRFKEGVDYCGDPETAFSDISTR